MSEEQHYGGSGLLGTIEVIKKNLIFLLVIFIVFLSAAGVVSRLSPNMYQSSLSFYLQRRSGRPTIQMEAGAPGGEIEAKLCGEIIQTDRFLKTILKEQGLAAEPDNVALFRERVNVVQKDTGTLQISVSWTEPQIAFELTERIFQKYQQFIEEQINTIKNTSQQYIEEQIEKSWERLSSAEEALLTYQREKGITFLPGTTTKGIEYPDERVNPKNISLTPEEMLQYGRLLREQKIAEEVYMLLVTQLELAKITQEKEDNVRIWVIDPPELPHSKYSPSTARNMAMAGLLAILFGMLWIFLRSYLRGNQQNKAL